MASPADAAVLDPPAGPVGRTKAQHDLPGFRAFYEATSRPLWAYLLRATGRPELADDLAQESYLRYLRSGFVGESREHRRNYLYRIATNLLRDRRRRPSEAPLETAEVGTAPAPEVPLRRDVARLLGELPERERQLVWLAHAEGRSHAEIGEILGVKPASVRVLLFRARAKLATLARRRGLGRASS